VEKEGEEGVGKGREGEIDERGAVTIWRGTKRRRGRTRAGRRGWVGGEGERGGVRGGREREGGGREGGGRRG